MSKRHGESYTHLYAVWKSMRQRCQNKRHHAYGNYGGRGIKVCAEWQTYETFRDWALASGYDKNAPRGTCTLDRIDNNGDYEPFNCRWADATEQANNRRQYPRPNARAVEQIGIDVSVLGWYPSIHAAARATGINRCCIRDVCLGKLKTAHKTRWRYATA